MRRALVIISVLVIWQFRPVYAESKAINFEVPISPALFLYIDPLLVAPSYAVLALENSGLAVSLSQPVKLLSRESFQVGFGKISYQKKKNNVYFYTVSLLLPLGKEITFPVEIDVPVMSKGFLKIRAYPEILGLIPQDMILRADSKLQMLSNLNSQEQLIEYLYSDKRRGRKLEEKVDSKFYDTIAFDAYNLLSINNSQLLDPISVSGAAQSGARVGFFKRNGFAEPTSDQISLIWTIVIWLVGFPIYIFLIRRQRKYLIISAKTE